MKNFIKISIAFLGLALLTALFAEQAFAANPVAVKAKTDTLKSPPSITVVTPKAGDSFGAGTQTTVSWTYKYLKGTVRVLLYKAGAPVANPVIVSLTLTGTGSLSFSWIIDTGLTPGSDYTIVVESNDNPGVKGASPPFTILPFQKGKPPKLTSNKETNEVILPCPDTISVRVGIEKKHYKNLPPGFIGQDIGNDYSTFQYYSTGMDNDRACFCMYEAAKNIRAYIYANMPEYARCNAEGYKQLKLYKK